MFFEPRRPKGRPANYVIDRQGRPIVGLSRMSPPDGRYYATYSQPRKYFGATFDAAVSLFKAWEAKEKGETVSILVIDPKSRTDKSGEIDKIANGPVETVTTPNGQDGIKILHDDFIEIRSQFIWDKVSEWILKDPIEASKRLHIPQIANLYNLQPPPPTLTLRLVWEIFENRQRPITAQELSKCKVAWEEFERIVGVETLREIKAEHIFKYNDTIYEQYAKGERKKGKRDGSGRGPLSSTWINGKFQRVKTVLRYAIKYGRKDPTDIKKVLTFCECLVPPPKTGDGPQLISPEDFKKMLDVCDVKWKAGLLLSLNCAFYPIDLASVKKSAINLEKGTLIFPRTKTKVSRVAILWNRTKDAIKEYLRTEPHCADFLFRSTTGKGYHRDQITKQFREIRDAAKVSPEIKFCHIRDSAATVTAGKVNADSILALLGHKIPGERNKYTDIRVFPEIDAAACMVIENFYFGSSA